MAPSKKLLQYKQPEKSYDVVIIGGGLHGLATAYNLARYHGVKRIAVLEQTLYRIWRLWPQHGNGPLQ